MKKIIFVLLAVGLMACKKDKETESSSGSGRADDVTIHTYLGYAGYRVTYDTIVDGVNRDTFNYQSPVVFSELDNTAVTVMLNGAVVSTGYTGSDGKYKISGLSMGNEYTFSIKSKTFHSDHDYYYSATYKANSSLLPSIYHVNFGDGRGITNGTGSTSTGTANPWIE
jgi:hypothetical protein